MNRCIVIHSTPPNTIAVGVYRTEKIGQDAYIRYLAGQHPELFSKVLETIATEHGLDLTDKSLTEVSRTIYGGKNQDVLDTFKEEVSHDIGMIRAKESFDSRTWDRWDNASLHRLRTLLWNGEFGDTFERVKYATAEDGRYVLDFGRPRTAGRLTDLWILTVCSVPTRYVRDTIFETFTLDSLEKTLSKLREMAQVKWKEKDGDVGDPELTRLLDEVKIVTPSRKPALVIPDDGGDGVEELFYITKVPRQAHH